MDSSPQSKQKHNTAILVAVIGALAAVAVIFALLNADSVSQKKEMQDNATFLLIAGEQSTLVSMEDIEALGPVEVEGNYKKNNKAPESRMYTGVPLAAVLATKEIPVEGYKSVSFTAADGYASAISMEDALNAESCLIVIAEEGAALGKREDGGSGPFMMILAQDAFSQRWCKFLMEVKLQ